MTTRSLTRPAEAATAARLRCVSDRDPGLTRARVGRGFADRARPDSAVAAGPRFLLGCAAIYSPDIERNLATVEPLARLSGVEVTRKSAVSVFSAGAIAEEILERHAGGVVVWVGNVSGYLQAVYGWLGGDGMGPVDYGDLHILTIPPSGPVRVEKLRYGP